MVWYWTSDRPFPEPMRTLCTAVFVHHQTFQECLCSRHSSKVYSCFTNILTLLLLIQGKQRSIPPTITRSSAAKILIQRNKNFLVFLMSISQPLRAFQCQGMIGNVNAYSCYKTISTSRVKLKWGCVSWFDHTIYEIYIYIYITLLYIKLPVMNYLWSYELLWFHTFRLSHIFTAMWIMPVDGIMAEEWYNS